MLGKNYLLEKLNNNEKCMGTWITIPSEIVVDIATTAGLDYLIIDMEHGPISLETAEKMIITAESNNSSPLIRLGEISESQILRALDIGCHGLIFPNISNIKQIEEIINLTNFPPKGSRGFSPFVRASKYNKHNSTQFNELSNDNLIRGIIIENPEAINNIDKFLAYDDINLYFIGLYDLSVYLGYPGNIENPRLIEFLNELVKKITNKNKFVGTIASSMSQLNSLKDIGLSFYAYLVDSQIIFDGYQNPVKAIKKE